MLSRVASKVGKRGFSTYPSFITNAPATEVSKTSNGVTVASEAAVGETATVKVWFDAGSRYESGSNIGSAKFLEHLAFKNSKAQTEIANLGGQVTAHTSRDRTVFSAKVFKGDVAKAVGLLADVVNSANDDAAIAREKEAFFKHHETVQETFQEVTLDHLHTTAYMGTNLGRSIVGADANTKNLTKNDLNTYINNNWTSNRLVVAGAGAIDHKQLTELTQTHFGGLKTGLAASEAAQPAIFTGSDKRVRYDSMGKAHVALAFQTGAANSEYRFPLKLLKTLMGNYQEGTVLGRNQGAKLARQLACDHSATSYTFFNQFYKETSLFGVYYVANDVNVEGTLWSAMDEIVRLSHDISDREIEVAKTQLKFEYLAERNNECSLASDIGLQFLAQGRRLTTAEVFARIDALTTADIKATANKFFNDEDPALAGLGAIFELPDYNWVRRRTFWMRY